MSRDKSKYILPEKLKQLLQRKGLSVADLSSCTEIPVKTIYGWFAGNSPRSLEDVFKVAQCLETSIEELAFDPDKRLNIPNRFAELGAWFRISRERMRLTTREVSQEIGLSKHRLEAFEEGSAEITLKELTLLAQLYQLDKVVVAEKIVRLI